MTVLQALQLQTPTAKALSSAIISISDLDLNFLIFVISVSLVKQCIEVRHAFHIEEDAAFRVLRDSASVEADAGSVGYVLDLREHLLELEREGAFEGVRAGGDEVVGVFEGLKLMALVVVLPIEEVKGECAGDGFSLGLIAGQINGYHRSKIFKKVKRTKLVYTFFL